MDGMLQWLKVKKGAYVKLTSGLWYVNCPQSSQCYLPPNASEHAHCTALTSGKLALDLPTPEGWKAE